MGIASTNRTGARRAPDLADEMCDIAGLPAMDAHAPLVTADELRSRINLNRPGSVESQIGSKGLIGPTHDTCLTRPARFEP